MKLLAVTFITCVAISFASPPLDECTWGQTYGGTPLYCPAASDPLSSIKSNMPKGTCVAQPKGDWICKEDDGSITNVTSEGVVTDSKKKAIGPFIPDPKGVCPMDGAGDCLGSWELI